MQVFIAIKCLLQKEAMVHWKDTEFRNTGLERSEVLAKDLEWFRQQGHAIPEPLTSGVSYARYLEELSERILKHLFAIFTTPILRIQLEVA
ncbi:hypothetical protein P3L10_025509 [Capsicum annuum]